ncbi:MAG: acyl-CoA dehydrogenase family protein [Acidimicrobiales bacterium]
MTEEQGTAERQGMAEQQGTSRPPDSTDFEGRAELEELLESLLAPEWVDAARRSDEGAMLEAKAAADNPAIVRELGAHGWVAPHYAPEHGGRGLSRPDAQAALTLLADWEVPHVPRGSGLPLAAPTIQQWSSDETKRRLLPPLLRGDERWCQLFSEPGAGSDMASLATSAVRDGDEWIINGQKVWTTFGHESEMAMLLARTDPDQPKHKGITYFGLDMQAPGVEVRPLVNMAGQLEFNEVFLTDVRVHDLLRISPIGEGWGASLTTLGAERHALSGTKKKKRKSSDEILGGKPFDEVRARAVENGAALDPVARQRLVTDYAAGQVLSLTSARARAKAAAGQQVGPEGSISKIAKAASNQALQESAMSFLGADATAWESDDTDAAEWIEQFLRTRANSIEGGTSEIQRNIVGERVLGLPREPDPFKGQDWRSIPR